SWQASSSSSDLALATSKIGKSEDRVFPEHRRAAIEGGIIDGPLPTQAPHGLGDIVRVFLVARPRSVTKYCWCHRSGSAFGGKGFLRASWPPSDSRLRT